MPEIEIPQIVAREGPYLDIHRFTWHFNLQGIVFEGAKSGRMDPGQTSQPTISGIRSTARALTKEAGTDWWHRNRVTLSGAYRKWDLEYSISEPRELRLVARQTLHRLLALRTTHGDFASYHGCFRNIDAELDCPCGRAKTPEHLVFCEISTRRFHQWPLRPKRPPSNAQEGHEYLRKLIVLPSAFQKFLEVTNYFSFCNRPEEPAQ